MKLNAIIGAAAIGLSCAAAVAAPVTYEGTLFDDQVNAGSVGGFSWYLDQGAGVDLWRFFAVAGSTVTLSAARLNGNLDPAMSVYLGLTTADISSFRSSNDWGGLTYLAYFDDENAPNIPGPFGDPGGALAITTTGWYTVAVGGGSGSSDAGPYGYQIAAEGTVPEPTSVLLVAIGLGCLVGTRRRVKV